MNANVIHLADATPRSSAPRVSDPGPSLQPRHGSVDGRYNIERFLAWGGAAEVYAARHRFTGRSVALKLPKRGAPPEVHARIRCEIELLGRIHHPGVVEMLDAGESADGPYVVMELLEGRTLEALVASRGTIGEDEVIRVGHAVAVALAACHEQGILHRDVKPSNVIVLPNGEPKLIDFNVARETDPNSRRLTQAGQVVGTPDYMPIEAMLGLATADHRVDVFGFGMTLYECLIGSVPMAYSARNITASDVQARRPDVSWDLATLIEGCLQRDPAKRTQTMREVVDALAALVPAPSLRPRRSPAPKHLEGRRHPRAPFLTPARLIDDAGNRSDVRIEEISISGAQLVSRELHAQGAKVRVRFALPTGAIAECDAVVRWSRKGDRVAVAGIEFQGLGHAETAVIQLYVEGVGRAGRAG